MNLVSRLGAAVRRPEPFEPGAPFWDDPGISARLLDAHLDPTHDAASRRPADIEATCRHLERLGLAGPGRRVLDLGCGPGLYADRLAAGGTSVTGIDLSERSIEHARSEARRQGREIDYRVGSFLDLVEPPVYDLVIQVYGEFSTLSPADRSRFLAGARATLAPGGALVLDVSTPAAHPDVPPAWSVGAGGLWREGEHLVLEAQHRYDRDLSCMQYVVADDDAVTVYRMWFQDYAPTTLVQEFARAGFTIERQWADLGGSAQRPDDAWIAVLARPTTASRL